MESRSEPRPTAGEVVKVLGGVAIMFATRPLYTMRRLVAELRAVSVPEDIASDARAKLKAERR